MKRTHYRKVFKSDHLGVADLEEFTEEGRELVFTIKEVKQEYNTLIAGKHIDANIAYFEDDIKPLVLNATNSKTLKALSGSFFVEDWKGLLIRLEIDQNVRMKGQLVGGVRISKFKPKPKVKFPELTPKHEKWNILKEKVKSGEFTLKAIKEKHFTISEANEKLLTQ